MVAGTVVGTALPRANPSIDAIARLPNMLAPSQYLASECRKTVRGTRGGESLVAVVVISPRFFLSLALPLPSPPAIAATMATNITAVQHVIGRSERANMLGVDSKFHGCTVWFTGALIPHHPAILPPSTHPFRSHMPTTAPPRRQPQHIAPAAKVEWRRPQRVATAPEQPPPHALSTQHHTHAQCRQRMFSVLAS